jgi:uncharacterized membrane protein YkvI
VTSPTVATRFQRFILPGLAFKAVVIGGGYATGRELAEYFLPSGAWGGLAAIALATALFSLLCILTFLFARRFSTWDYVSFFKALLGPGWMAFEGAYILFIILILAVYGAAAGAIGAALLGWPPVAGTLLLAAAIMGVVAFGNRSVERMFAWVSVFLYAVYALFVLLAFTRFGDRIAAAFTVHAPMSGWVSGGTIYAGYNIVGAVIVLPVIRHLTSDRDGVVAGLVAGPLATVPGLLFFMAMIAFNPAIAGATLPSDYLLKQLHLPLFEIMFQLMIFAALLESGASSVHAINERIAKALLVRHERVLSDRARAAIAVGLLLFCMIVAQRFGLVALIANGYRALAYLLIAIYVVPLLTIGLWRLLSSPQLDENNA